MRHSARRAFPLVFLAALLLSFTIWASRATADPPALDGAWTASPMTESITVTSWVDECGPRPKPRVLGGGAYTITTAGDELVFSGAQPFRTDACFTQEETRRVSHSATPSLRTWKTRCESAPGDPRKASLTTVVRATSDDTIVLTETAHYASTLQNGTCAADVERARSFSRLAPKPTASTSVTSVTTTASATTTTIVPPKTPICEGVGDPAKLEVRPKRKVIRPGESFDFVARILDDKGCETTTKSNGSAGPSVTFRLAPESSSLASAVLVDPGGHVKVRADAEPVDAALVVEAGPPLSTSVHVDLEIVSDERYAELLGTGGLDDAGVDDRPVSVVVSNGTSAPSSIVEPVGDEAARKRFAWLAIFGGIGVLLALIVFVAARRRPRDGTERAEFSRDATSTPPSLPVARNGSTREGGIRTVRGVPEAPATPPGATPAAPTQVGAPELGNDAIPYVRICPRCGERYPSDAGFCPIDGSHLVAVRDPTGKPPIAAPSEVAVGAQGRICPVCGKRYARDASFCGSDGVELVPLN